MIRLEYQLISPWDGSPGALILYALTYSIYPLVVDWPVKGFESYLKIILETPELSDPKQIMKSFDRILITLKDLKSLSSSAGDRSFLSGTSLPEIF